MRSLLQLPPPLELAIGQLSPAEQSHAAISMRVLAAHLDAPCVVVTKDSGDITLKPCEDDAQSLCVASAYDQARIDRPMRLVPLSEALAKLIDGILARTGRQVDTAPVAAESIRADATSPAAGSLLDTLLRRDLAGPLEIVLSSGSSLLVDRRYAMAHLSAPVSQLLPALIDESVISIQPIAAEEFSRRTAKGNPLHPVSVEQLCWSLPVHGNAIPELDRRHQDEQAQVSLDTWPNLSAQPDAAQWLQILARLHRQGMRVGQLRHALVAAGISAPRARHGISLLLSYRHARIAIQAVPTASQAMPTSTSTAARQASAGLLGRLRMRLRALAA